MPRSTLGTKMVKRCGFLERETNWEQIDLILSPIARISCSIPTNGNELEERGDSHEKFGDRDESKICNWEVCMREVFNADANDLEEGAGSNEQGIATIIIYVQMSIYRINSENGLHK